MYSHNNNSYYYYYYYYCCCCCCCRIGMFHTFKILLANNCALTPLHLRLYSLYAWLLVRDTENSLKRHKTTRGLMFNVNSDFWNDQLHHVLLHDCDWQGFHADLWIWRCLQSDELHGRRLEGKTAPKLCIDRPSKARPQTFSHNIFPRKPE